METGIHDPRVLIEKIVAETISRGLTNGTLETEDVSVVVNALHAARLLPDALCADLFAQLERNCALRSETPVEGSTRLEGYGLSNGKLREEMKKALTRKLDDIKYVLTHKHVRPAVARHFVEE